MATHTQHTAEGYSTADILPVLNVDRDCIALDNGRYSTMLRLEGLGSNTLSTMEKAATVNGIGESLMTLDSAFSLVAHVRPRDLSPMITELGRRAQTERNPALQARIWDEQDLLLDLNDKHSLTRRDYFLTIAATEAERSGGIAPDESEQSVGHMVKQRMADVFGIEAGRATKEPGGFTRAHSHSVPPNIAEALRFRAGSVANLFGKMRMAAQPMTTDETISALGEMLGNPAEIYSATHADARTRLASGAWHETAHNLRQGERLTACLYVTGYPRSLPFGALFELVRMRDIHMTVALQAKPLDTIKVLDRLRSRQEILMVTQATSDRRISDIGRNVRMAQLRELNEELERGTERLFSVGLRVAIHATSRAGLHLALRRVQAQLAGMGYSTALATHNQRRAFLSCLPLGVDYLAQDRVIGGHTVHPNVTSKALACLLPNCIVDFTQDKGILIGVSESDGGLILYNRWSKNIQSPHSFFIASTGGGKTVSIEIELVRELIADPELVCFAIDPQGFMGALAQVVGGEVIRLGPNSKHRINMFDLYSFDAQGEKIAKRLDFLYPMISLMVRTDLTQSDRSALNVAVKGVYDHFENGTSIIHTLYHSFSLNPRYAALRARLNDTTDSDNTRTPGIMSRLTDIYREMHARHHIPTVGKVAGSMTPTGYRRPVCYLKNNRWWYAGAGETDEPFEAAQARALVETALSDARVGIAENRREEIVGALAEAYRASKRTDFATLRSTTPAVRERFDELATSGAQTEAIRAVWAALDAQNKRLGAPAVWYPDPTWFKNLVADFEQLIEEREIFAGLDDAARAMAIRDAFVELKRGMPILSDLLPLLAAEGRVSPSALMLVNNLSQYVDPDTFGPMFNGFTNINLDSRCIVFDTRDLGDDEMRLTETFKALKFIWDKVRSQRKKYICVVDELGYQLESGYSDVANFNAMLYMRGRAFGLSMIGVVQNLMTLTGIRAARLCLQNSGRKVLLHNEEEALPDIRATLGLTEGECEYILNAAEGESLQLISRKKTKTRLEAQYTLSSQQLAAFDTRVKDDEQEAA